MKKIFNRVKAYVLDKKLEKKEAKLAEKRAAMAETYAYVAPVLTVATMTTTALMGHFSFM